MSVKRDLDKLKRLEALVSTWKADKNTFPQVITVIRNEELWRLVGNSFEECLELEFGIPQGSGFLITTGEVVPP